MNTTFEDLIAEGAAQPTEGWDFSWFAGRATEERPPWGFSRLLGERMARASAALDLQTGGGEVLAEIPKPPPVLAATEGWPPNVSRARETLAPLGGEVHEVPNDAALPFPDAAFDLVTTRHPTFVPWPEVARVLRPGGTYLAQHVGGPSAAELTEFMMGSCPPSDPADPTFGAEGAKAAAEAAGLTVTDLRTAVRRVEFFDIAAVVLYLRKVIWIVPGFDAERYRERLAALHERIVADGVWTMAHHRFLIEARKL
ncbi:class I SAM-dependent methyltransferase [Amycolatopsis sp. NPDC059027]|uniref:class I SAM-dependent methyltransferase n=1 Tax=Amycolatopsis sp. NPDC059027 TaxID=3346709 RepID=UPI00366B77DD